MEHAAKPREVAGVIALGAAWMFGLWLEAPGWNGPWYWQWHWRSLDLVHTLGVFVAPLCVLGFLAWTWSKAPPLTASDARLLAGALTGCQVLLQWARLAVEPGGWAWFDTLVQSHDVTSYYTDALSIDDLGAFLRDYSWRQLEHHSSTHPPGPVLYYWAFLQVFSAESAGRWAAASVAVLGSAGVAVAYRFAALWTPDRSQRLGACFLYTLMPALTCVLPSFDVIYPIFTMAALIFWQKAWERNAAAVALGLCMFVATNMAYQCLLLPIPLALYAIASLRLNNWDAELRRSMFRACALAFGAWLAAYALVYALTPFEPLASLSTSLARQASYAAFMERPYGTSLLYDPYDFFLGGGVLVAPLLVLHIAREERRSVAITLAGVVAILLIDLSGLIRCEAARVWLFLQPLAIVPAGLTLARWNPLARAAVLALQGLILIAIVCKLIFLRVP